MQLVINKHHENGETEVIEIEFSEKLQTALNVQKRFAKPFLKAAHGIPSMTVEELISFLSCGLKSMKPDDFKELALEHMGLNDLYDAVSKLVLAIQYPGLSEDEIEKKVQAQQEKIRKMNLGSTDLSKQEPLSD